MTEVAIGRARDTDLAEILEDYPRFWGDRAGPRALHHWPRTTAGRARPEW
jgi:hypothetical protein